MSRSVAPELLSAPCPPLMLISLAENAVKHGVEPKIGTVHVEVHARQRIVIGHRFDLVQLLRAQDHRYGIA